MGCGVVGQRGVHGGVNFILGQILQTVSLLCFFIFLRVWYIIWNPNTLFFLYINDTNV